jgi:ribosomal peptide maturation radical SAM protein 1
MMDPPRVILVSMPWESASRPSLAIGTLTAIARQAGFDCTAQYLNLDLAARMGADAYNAFAENVALFPLGEHCFAVDLFGVEALDSESYLGRFGGTQSMESASPDPLHVLRDRTVPGFLDAATVRIAALRPDVVGFSCTFNQTLPSLALARRLKAALPNLKVLVGGACVHGRMGETYAETFTDLVDHVFTGEADDSFPAWLRAFVDGEPSRPLPGVAGGNRHLPGRVTQSLDRLPIPVYDEYFEQRASLEAAGASLTPVRHLPYESSRGCWWGEKHHCTFCGLNNQGMLFRRKSSERVVAELEKLADAYGVTSFMASDNILDFRAYSGMLADLERSPVDFDLFYEMKANVRRVDVAALRRAGVRRVQPGIESFSDHVLRLMRKGTNGLQNVQLLKWLQEHGVSVDYNVLVGFPGETLEDYHDNIRVIAAISHLPPPNGSAITVRVDRFSPFFDSADALGIRGLRAAAHYRFLIPPDVVAAERYAYFFDRDETDLAAFAEPIAELNDLIAMWKRGQLERRARLGRTFVELLQADDCGRSRRALRDLDALVFVLADSVTSVQQLHRWLGNVAQPGEVAAAIARLTDAQAIVRSGDRIVTSIAYAEPHTDAELQAWAGRNGLPARSASEPVLVVEPASRRGSYVPTSADPASRSGGP